MIKYIKYFYQKKKSISVLVKELRFLFTRFLLNDFKRIKLGYEVLLMNCIALYGETRNNCTTNYCE